MFEKTSFTLDRNNCIIETNRAWDRFAEENGAPELNGRAVRGHSLFRYIVGDTTRMYIRTIIDYVRLLEKPLVRDYRCDSDQLKRFMQMRVSPVGEKCLLLEHEVLKTEPLIVPIRFHYQPTADYPLLRCSNCNRVKNADLWQEPDRALGTGSELHVAGYSTCYTVCEDCQEHFSRLAKQSANR